MRIMLPLLLSVSLAVTGCARVSQSRLNPLNWFGASTSEARDANGEIRPLIPQGRRIAQTVDARGLIGSVDTLDIVQTPSGAIVRATGTAATQGQFNAELVTVSIDTGVMTLAFRVESPTGFAPVGGTLSRQVTVARVFSVADLAGIRSVRVQGATNTRTSSR